MTKTLRTESGAPSPTTRIPNRGPARPRPAPGPAPAREARALQPRADPRAHRARGRLRRARPSRESRTPTSRAGRGPHVRVEGQAHAGLRALLDSVAGSKGAPDAVRDPRGFAIKFYTKTATGISPATTRRSSSCAIRIKFPDFIHSQKYDPYTNEQEPENVWDFFSHSPETTHQFTWLFGDRGIPATLRHMDGFGSHTFQMGERGGRALLGEVPLQDRPGHPLPHQRGRRASAARIRSTTRRTCAPRSSAASSRRGR